MKVACCIVGGGPAGMMLGYCLARRGVSVAVLEKHADFLRDFRGDTVHPSTMTVLDELGLLGEFLKLPHSEIRTAGGRIGMEEVTIADFSHVPARTRFLAFMPQWDFLSFLAERGRRLPGFDLLMSTAAVDVLRSDGRVSGVRAQGPDGSIEVLADVVVACDGRHSTLRRLLNMTTENLGAPMDVLWFRVSRRSDDPRTALGYIGAGAVLVCLDRNEYWQCGYIIPKGAFDEIKGAGLDAFHARISKIVPRLRDRMNEIGAWSDVRLLEVTVDRLRRWYRPGFLAIGDAAHAMSPIGGVGINLAIQDAVAAANILGPALKRGQHIREETLRRVQRRREWPTSMTQNLQLLIQRNAIARILGSEAEPRGAPWPVKIVGAMPLLQRIPAYLVGIGFGPEHVKPPASVA